MPDGPAATSQSQNQSMADSTPSHDIAAPVSGALTSTDPDAADLDLTAAASAVGPYTTAPPEPITASDANSASPPVQSLKIALLLSSGPRNTFTISRGYLRKRDCLPDSGDPYDISVYTLKSLIFREWHPDWEERPASPDYIRLIFFGSLLDDKSLLRDSRFSRTENNVVHMSIKPAEALDEDEMKSKEAKGRDGNNARPGLNCCVIL